MIAEGVETFGRDDDMVQEAEVESLAGAGEGVCDLLVGSAGLQDARGMVVAQDYAVGVVQQCLLQNLLGIEDGCRGTPF